MGRNKFILLSALLSLALLPACSREGSGNSEASAQPARGGSSDPGGGIISGATAPAVPGPPMKYQLPTLTSLSDILNSTNQEGLWTRTVQLRGATVQQVFGDKQFMLVGPDKDHTVLVQLNGSTSEFKPGQKVDIGGIIDPLGHDKTQWNVLSSERQILDQHAMFIRPTTIQPAK